MLNPSIATYQRKWNVTLKFLVIGSFIAEFQTFNFCETSTYMYLAIRWWRLGVVRLIVPKYISSNCIWWTSTFTSSVLAPLYFSYVILPTNEPQVPYIYQIFVASSFLYDTFHGKRVLVLLEPLNFSNLITLFIYQFWIFRFCFSAIFVIRLLWVSFHYSTALENALVMDSYCAFFKKVLAEVNQKEDFLQLKIFYAR